MKRTIQTMIAVIFVVLISVFAASCQSSGTNPKDTPTAKDTPTESRECEHSYGKWSIQTFPTCTEAGVEKRTCNKCGESETKILKATGHTEVRDEAVAATCTETGLTEGMHCSVCGAVIKKQETVKLKSHTEVIDAAVAATCTETGLTEGTHCSVCGTVTKAQKAIAAKGHSYTVKTISAEYLKSKATCTDAAVYYYSCECGAKGTSTFSQGKPQGHSYTVKSTDSKYLKSSATDTKSAAYYYSCVCGEKGTDYFYSDVEVRMFLEGKEIGSVTATPNNGYKVTFPDEDELWEWSSVPATNTYCRCFNGWYTNSDMTVPLKKDAIFTKETKVYAEFIKFYSDHLKYSVSNGKATITGRDKSYTDTVIVIPDTINSFPVTRISDQCFRDDTMIKKVIIPDSVTSIGELAFANCNSLTSVVIPDSVTSIGYCVFYECHSLTSVVIPDSVTSISGSAFSDCTSLTSIKVDSKNTKYHSAGNCLIETASKKLIVGCNNSVIPTDGSVTSIVGYAFSGCSSLTSVVIPDSVTSIGERAFSGCSSLKTIYCRASSKPSGWSSDWKYDCSATVVWGYKG